MGRAHRRRYLIGGYAIMAKPKVMALFAPGTNCDEETIHCFKKSGADVDRVLVQDLFDGSRFWQSPADFRMATASPPGVFSPIISVHG